MVRGQSAALPVTLIYQTDIAVDEFGVT